jgi:phosphatidylinositol phospholipase C delta
VKTPSKKHADGR